jgi:phosphohistidine swiveling domain-containing protein
MTDMVRSFSELPAERQESAGGKGGALARLYQAGYPVPDGFVILPSAFAGDRLKPEAWAQVRAYLARMRGADGSISFAVRSSALSEDSSQASFAGEFETVLDVHTDETIRAAIHTVRQSGESERVQAYSKAKGIDLAQDMAIVIQCLIRADISGVLFTADPVMGSRVNMLGNYVYGFGDELVSGKAEPYTFTLKRPKGQYEGPAGLKRFALRLYKLADRLEKEFDCPQDIEWAIAGGKLYLLQSRPVTTLIGYDPTTGEWNDSLTGDYAWTNQLTGEVFPEVMTPSTWSVWQILFVRQEIGGIPGVGNIGGRPYANVSLVYSLMMKFYRKHEKVTAYIENLFCAIPEGIDIPVVPISTRTLFLKVLPYQLRTELAKKRLEKDTAEYVARVPERCQTLQQQIRDTWEKAGLVSLWRDQVEPLFSDLLTLQDAANEKTFMLYGSLKKELAALCGPDDANTLLSTMGDSSEQLASIGPLAGLARIARGEMSREAYKAQYGHRGPYENYLSIPRPAEDPDWLNGQLASLERSPVDVEALLEKRHAEFEAAWQRFQECYSKKLRSIGRKIEQVAERSRARETVRVELTRAVGVIRALFLRAGELTGLDDGVFFLTYEELMDVLSGDDVPAVYIPARRETHARYRSLPPYPSFIRGRFDPVQWASDPNRRSDVFDAQGPVHVPDSDTIKGYAGSAGLVEGVVRRIDSPEQSDQLCPGEILVTATTNVGWTPLFPRAAAIVTDVGAQLSHAAIVAREIGIPAVVGCGNATMCLHSGDRVRVDGGRGIVEILKPRSNK